MDGGVRVGVLSLHSSKETKAICNAIEALGHVPEWLREENLIVRVRDGEITLEPTVDVVVNRLLLSNTDQPAEELGIAHTVDSLRPMLNSPDATARAAHKIATAAALACHHVALPDTALALSTRRLNALREEFGDEVVYKTAIGTHGGGAWKVGPGERITATVGKRRAFLQQFVRSADGSPRDLRVYVVGGEVVGAMHRFGVDGDWRTNVARGGRVTDATADLPDSVAETAVEATEIVGLDYAGVDLIQGQDCWYVLEVNPTAGFKGLYAATGRSPAPYIAKLAIERVGGRVDDERVFELAATLDDSTPSCQPVPEPTAFDRPIVVGLTERVVVSGTSATKTVVARCDTGTANTRIDISLAADIGAGPIHMADRTRTGHGRAPVVDLVVGIGGEQYTVSADIEDRAQANYPVVLGRDVLRHYYVDVSRNVESASERPIEE